METIRKLFTIISLSRVEKSVPRDLLFDLLLGKSSGF